MNDCANITVTEFYLTPFFTSRMNEILIFIGFLFMYLLAIVGNLIIIALICAVPQLHTPMYFFLCNLSSIDVIYVSAILPKMLSIILTEDKTISFYECMTQMAFFVCCGNADIYILTCMAYDRYVAVCSPLHYFLIMTRKIIPVMELSSSDTKRMKMIISMEDICVLASLIFILTSYVRIISTVVKIRSSSGQLKALSSCSSHIITVLLFYGPSIFMYMKPESEDSKEQDKILSMFYVAVVPMLNPFVYSLRNKDVLGAARKMAKVVLNKNRFSKH
ncbi:hypothetical protein GDO78_016449 [Eleutherodactylus coqui]|uniref:G-protein coupled receptors family 1 profile domain-containing protein n=1 Tax=Eleutherodactylus coqui TaxID=57060 RepID=A0A8J6EKQ6_ELECQ|nr:hypothetical protein GDO78_016449 [Eleutherodactylus coqui]